MPAQTDKTKTATIVEPPAIARRVESSVSESMLKSMAETIKPGVWVTDGESYDVNGKNPSRKAVNAAAKHKRPLARLMNVKPEKIRARVWQTDPDNEKSPFVFALTIKGEDNDETEAPAES